MLLSLMSTVAWGQKTQICFSIDDMPVVSYGINDSNYQKMIFNSIMSSLGKKGEFFSGDPVSPDYIK